MKISLSKFAVISLFCLSLGLGALSQPAAEATWTLDETPEKRVHIQPKPLLDVAPYTQSVIITTDLTAPTSGTRHVVLYNNGNGGLTLKGVSVTDEFNQGSTVFSLKNPPAADTLIQPGGLLVLEVDWNSANVPNGKTEEVGSLHIDYIHFSDGQVTENVYLKVQDSGGTEGPTATLGDAAAYAGAVAGENIVLNASGSSSGAYNFTGSNWALYYLTSKPAGSWAIRQGLFKPK